MKKNLTTLALFTVVILALFLRGFNLGSLISPYWEEVALGYDAYSIGQTGADHHGTPWPLVAFESFGDWKPSGYFYFAAASIKLFGLTVFSIRLPSMLAGLLIVVGMYFFSELLLLRFASRMPKTQVALIQLLSVFVTAVSSWLIMFSRAAWEVNLATAFLLWGIIFSLQFARNRKCRFLLISAVFFAVSVYTYHATRVIAPLIFLSILASTFFENIWSVFKKGVLTHIQKLPKSEVLIGCFFLLLLLPLIATLRSPEVSQRFAETSIFSRLDIITESNASIAAAGTPGARVFFHRYVLFSREVLTNALSHFSLDFLFIHGDVNKRHSTGYMGILYFLDAVFISFGIYVLVRRYKLLGAFLLIWLVIGVLPASISLATPHALRIVPIAPLVLFIVAIGMSEGYLLLKNNMKTNLFRISVISLASVYLLQVGAFWRYYTVIYPKESALEWQYGYQDVMTEVQKYVEMDKKVAVSREYGRPAMYYFFMNSIDPRQVQAQDSTEVMDQSEFITYKNIVFFDTADQVKDSDVIFASPKSKVVTDINDQRDMTQVYTLSSPTGIPLWIGYEKK